MSQLEEALLHLESGVNNVTSPVDIYWVTKTWIDTMTSVGWEFEDLYYAVSKVKCGFVKTTQQHRILQAFCETNLMLLPNAEEVQGNV